MARLHEEQYPEIERVLTHAEKTGEPIVRSMEYMYPHCGYERVNSQFMLGDRVLVAPVTVKGEVVKEVFLPDGVWEEQNTKTVFVGPDVLNVDAPLERLVWFVKKD
jgi:alpha-glucosidase (family GH31 glycosyl hydrolase)